MASFMLSKYETGPPTLLPQRSTQDHTTRSIYLICLKVICSLFFFSLSLFSSPVPKKKKKKKGLQSLTPTTHGMVRKPAGDNYQLLVAVVGSVTVTCVTILLALLALFFIRKTLLNRRRTFTYQSGSVRNSWFIRFVMNFIKLRCSDMFCLKFQFHSYDFDMFVLLLRWALLPPTGWGDNSAV